MPRRSKAAISPGSRRARGTWPQHTPAESPEQQQASKRAGEGRAGAAPALTLSPWRTASSPRMSNEPNWAPAACSASTTLREKPQRGASGDPCGRGAAGQALRHRGLLARSDSRAGMDQAGMEQA